MEAGERHAILVRRFPEKRLRMIVIPGWLHAEKTVHLDMQEGRLSDALQGPGKAGFARTSGSVQEKNNWL
jgi:hypothetical protein